MPLVISTDWLRRIRDEDVGSLEELDSWDHRRLRLFLRFSNLGSDRQLDKWQVWDIEEEPEGVDLLVHDVTEEHPPGVPVLLGCL